MVGGRFFSRIRERPIKHQNARVCATAKRAHKRLANSPRFPAALDPDARASTPSPRTRSPPPLRRAKKQNDLFARENPLHVVSFCCFFSFCSKRDGRKSAPDGHTPDITARSQRGKRFPPSLTNNSHTVCSSRYRRAAQSALASGRIQNARFRFSSFFPFSFSFFDLPEPPRKEGELHFFRLFWSSHLFHEIFTRSK